MFGFAALSIALAAFQLMLDRGEQKDWFESTEIWVYAVMLGLAGWLCTVHVATARNTFIRPELFKDRNFAIGSVLSMAVGVVAFATIPLIVVTMQNLLGFSALHTGVIGLPRGIGTLLAILLVTRLISRFDARWFVGAGLAITAFSMLMYARIDLQVDDWTLMVAGLVQGIGGGFMFLPLSVIVFATLPATLRNEGASMYALTKNVGQSIGISVLTSQLTHATASAQARLVEGVRPDNPLVDYARPGADFGSVETVAQFSREVAMQAGMVGNVQVYQLVFVIGLALLPLVLFMKSSDHATMPDELAAHVE
jgi:DHA2 family multidrug resistance protein